MSAYNPELPLKYDYFGDSDEILDFIKQYNLKDFLLCFYDNVLLDGFDMYHITIELQLRQNLILTIYTGATFTDSDLDVIYDRLVPIEVRNYISLEITRD